MGAHRRERASLSESGLSLAGLVQLQDPPRPASARTIATCHEAGIDVAPVTGDHRAKAANVATLAGIPANRQYAVARATPAQRGLQITRHQRRFTRFTRPALPSPVAPMDGTGTLGLEP